MPFSPRYMPVIAALTALTAACSTSLKSDVKMTGEQVYQQTCIACHGTGVNNAPRYQDKTGWAKLLEEGQVVLSAHGWVGVRGMPAQGGNPTLSLDEFGRAVAYMGRGVGADWQDPDADMLTAIEQEVEARRKELAATNH